MNQDAYDELLRDAARYIWWEPPGEAVRRPERVVAQVMDIGDHEDVQRMVSILGVDFLREVLLHAEPGWFRERSWAYWWYRLGLAAPAAAVPAMPRREVP